MTKDKKSQSRSIARERFWSEYDKLHYICPGCHRGIGLTSGFEVHHIDGNAHNNRMDNLVALCSFCHNLHEDRKPSMSDIQDVKRELKLWIDKSTSEGNKRTEHEEKMQRLEQRLQGTEE
jgi:5-methylcytosine-specific restriction endonuclease McrA